MTPPKRRAADSESAWKTIAVYAVSILVATGGSIGGYRAIDRYAPSAAASEVVYNNDATTAKLDRAIDDIGELRGEMKQVRDSLARLEAKLAIVGATQ